MKNINYNDKSENRIQGWRKWAVLVSLSLLAGCINGFAGTGGGIALVFLLLLLNSGEEDGTKNAYARTLVTVIPMSFTAFIVYLRSGSVDTELIGRVLVPTAIGGAVGALLMDRIDKKWLNLIFSALVIYSGITLAVRVL